MKYRFEKISDNKSYVWHFDGNTQTLIAITDSVEKAHFLATAANHYKEPVYNGCEDVAKHYEEEPNSKEGE